MDAVVALLRYVAPQAQPLHTYAYDPPDGALRFNGTLVEHAMSIHDARGLGHSTDFQDLRFTLTEHHSDVLHSDSDRQVIDVSYPEAEMLVRRVTGAPHARVFEYTLRRRAANRSPLDGPGGSFAAVREPVGRVHADYTPMSAPIRLNHVIGEETAERVCRDDLVFNDIVYRGRRAPVVRPLRQRPGAWCSHGRMPAHRVRACADAPGGCAETEHRVASVGLVRRPRMIARAAPIACPTWEVRRTTRPAVLGDKLEIGTSMSILLCDADRDNFIGQTPTGPCVVRKASS